jgi:hypothetical protein
LLRPRIDSEFWGWKPVVRPCPFWELQTLSCKNRERNPWRVESPLVVISSCIYWSISAGWSRLYGIIGVELNWSIGTVYRCSLDGSLKSLLMYKRD